MVGDIGKFGFVSVVVLKISIAGVARSHLLFSGFGNWGSKTF